LIEKSIQALLDHFAKMREAAVDLCFGEQISTGNTTVVPVMEVAFTLDAEIG